MPKPKATPASAKRKVPRARAPKAREDDDLDAIFGRGDLTVAPSPRPPRSPGRRVGPVPAFDFTSFSSAPAPPPPLRKPGGRKARLRDDDGLPLATMPFHEFEAYLEATSDECTLDRRQRAMALGAVLVRTLEAGDHPERTPALVLRVIESLERAWLHFRPESTSTTAGEGRVDYYAVEALILDLEWVQWAARAQEVDASSLASWLARERPEIPKARWAEALAEWRGIAAAPAGRPARGARPYYWHRVLFALLTGRRDELDAERFRGNYLKWQRARNSVRSPT